MAHAQVESTEPVLTAWPDARSARILVDVEPAVFLARSFSEAVQQLSKTTPTPDG
jgi:hypothetical protein